MSQSFSLFQLQQIDRQIDQKLARVREIEAFLEQDVTVKSAQAIKELAAQQQLAASQKLKKAEEAVEAKRIKIQQSESSLYGGKIHNPKELQGLQTEIASLKKNLEQLEENQLEAMLTLEDADKILSLREADYNRVFAESSQKNASLAGERSELLHQIERLNTERKAAAGQVLENNLQEYETLRGKKKGIAVTSISDYSCDTCGAEITPAEWQAARSPGKIIHCPSCGRILYAG